MADQQMRTLAHRTDMTEPSVVHVDTFIALQFDDASSDTRYELVGPAHELLNLLSTAVGLIAERGVAL